VGGKPSTWHVIGFTEDIGSPATAYVSLVAFARHTGTPGRINSLRTGFTDRSKDFALTKTREVEALLTRNSLAINASTPVWRLHNAVAAHMRVLVNSLLAMALLMALVGSLGLMSTMSMNVMERTREIGVMRAIGATPAKITSVVVGEGLFIGAISILLAFVLSLFLSSYIGRMIGHMAFRTPLSLNISGLACISWVGIMTIGSFIATLLPARRANAITTREALAYE
jgi:putative ABC transport system permease protein